MRYNYEEEDFFFYGTRSHYEAPYTPTFFPPPFRPKNADADWDPPAEVGPWYPKTNKAPAVALSIPPAVEDPLPRIRILVAALQENLRKTLHLEYTPTVYLTLLPKVPGRIYRHHFGDADMLTWKSTHTHPGVRVVHRVQEQGGVGSEVRMVRTVRLDDSWQAVLHTDPATYITDDWVVGFPDYTLRVFGEVGEHELRYQTLHDACPLIGVLIDPGFEGCVSCPRNDIYCRTRFLREALDAVSPSLLDQTVWLRDEGDVDSAMASLRCTSYHPVTPKAWKRSTLDIEAAGWRRLTRAQVHGLHDDQCRLHSLRLGWGEMRSRVRDAKASAERGAKSRRTHNDVCGTGDDACVLRAYGCTAWKTYTGCSGRRRHVDELTEEARANWLALRPEDRIPLLEVQRSALLARVGFKYVSDTGRYREGLYGNASLPRGGLCDWSIVQMTRSKPERVKFRGWDELRRWVRHHAPWELERLDLVDEQAQDIVVPQDQQVLFHAMLSVTSITRASGWGSTHYPVQIHYPVIGIASSNTVDHVRAWHPHTYLSAETMFDFWALSVEHGFTRASGLLPA